jgi:hypothetical protein
MNMLGRSGWTFPRACCKACTISLALLTSSGGEFHDITMP